MSSIILFRRPRGWLLSVAMATVATCGLIGTAHARDVPPPQQQAKPVTDYLGVPGPIQFDGTAYRLAWSHFGGNQIKQEYVPAGQSPDNYQSMLILDVLLTEATPLQIASHMAQQIKDRKASDPLANQELLASDDTEQVLLDFLLSQPQGKDSMIIEWNGYRYVRLRADTVGTLAISRRVQGGDAQLRPFLEALKTQRVKDVKTLASMPLPDIRLPGTSPTAPAATD